MSTIYRGRGGDACLVSVFEEGTGVCRELNPRLDLRNHSPTGFSWGYEGSGPSQLALAILADHLNDDKRALAIYQEFKRMVVARLPMEYGFGLRSEFVEKYVGIIEAMQASTNGGVVDLDDFCHNMKK